MTIACGGCVGCRLSRATDWAVRCYHEAHMHSHSVFLTLTYRDEDLPWDTSLDKKHLQDFIKRLRKHFKNNNIRYFACGEYGDLNQRPHYHLCAFGVDFEDKELWKKGKGGHDIYISNTLSKIWPFGYSTIGSMTFQSAHYTARYLMKKHLGNTETDIYDRTNATTGEITKVIPEFNTMSLKPGLGYDFYQKYMEDIFPHDYCEIDGKRYPVPRYYDKLLERDDPYLLEEIQHRRYIAGLENQQTPKRLEQRADYQNHLQKQIQRETIQ